MKTPIRYAALGVMLFALSACSSLPRGSAAQSELLRGADDADAGFALYPVTRDFLPSLESWPAVDTSHHHWIGASRGSTSPVLRPGDTLTLRVWDSDDNTLLAELGQRSAVVEDLMLNAQGSIFVPYVGQVNVSGRTPDQARRMVQTRLETLSPSAQVQLMAKPGRSSSVDLVGGVAAPGSYPLQDNDTSVLSLLAQGGGVTQGMRNPLVRLVRGGQVYATTVAELYADPALDTRLRGRDKVIVEDDSRYFLSVGAAGSEALHSFPKAEVSAMDAISIVGGVQDSRGDPQGVLVLREYPRSALAPGQSGPREERVVFSIDLTTPDGLFSARNFAVQSEDVILVTESPVTSVETVLGLVGRAFGVVNVVSN